MSLQSLIGAGTKVWSDSIDPDLIAKFSPLGISGATSNPIIIADLIKTGRFDDTISELFEEGGDDTEALEADAQHPAQLEEGPHEQSLRDNPGGCQHRCHREHHRRQQTVRPHEAKHLAHRIQRRLA